MGRVQDQVAVVTGAARGLGEAISYRLAEDGARLVLADIDGPRLETAAVKIREQVDIRNMRKDIARLSSLSTRVTGYPEAANASKYIFDRFTEIGLQNVEGLSLIHI